VTQFVDYLLGGLSSGAIFALFALALVLTWRATRVVNFAQVGQAMFTTFVGLTLQDLTGSWFVALLGAIVAGALLGMVVQVLVLRPMKRMDTSGAIIATFGVLISLQAAAGMIWGGDTRAYPQPFPNTSISVFGRDWPLSVYDLVVVAAAIVLVVGLTLLFTRTNLGLAMRATAFNPEVARLSGIRVSQTLTIGWALAGAVGAVAGVLVAPVSTLSPNSFDIILVFAFTAAVIGGLDSLVGAVAFGVGTGLVLSVVSGYSDSSNAPIVALVLLALNLLIKPDGVFGHTSSRSV
jgi:branched-chain amino acid transport system permease protein